MKHFRDWQWADYVRGVVEPAARTGMETHLSSGCHRCGRVVDVLQGVALIAQRERDHEPPEQVIRNAKAIYALHKPEKLPKAVARLIHDSFRAPLPAGLRNSGRVARHALFLAGSYYLDLQLEYQPASALVTLVGQLANRDRLGTSPAGTPVSLKERDRLVASAVCNQFGEFQLQYNVQSDLHLHLALPTDGKRLEIPLNTVSPASFSQREAARKRRRRT
jgi:hypothetical protein